MSSTNRANAAARHKSDYYVTPIPAIRDFLTATASPGFANLEHSADFCNHGVSVLDPCAGGDASHPMSYPAALADSGWIVRSLDTVDCREDSLAQFKCDYLTRPAPETLYDVAITNPPFNLALPIINKCLSEVRRGGLVIMLLRLNFFGSQERSAWFKDHMPAATYVHSKRMRFADTSGTDSIEYMHAVWVVGQSPSYTQLRLI
jgi:hypothetical protein